MSKLRLPQRIMLTLNAFVVFHLTILALRFFPYRRVAPRLLRQPRRVRRVSADRADAMVKAVTRALDLVQRYDYRLREDCLPRALTIHYLLRRRGIDSSFRIGVRQFPFAAHAWVERRGQVIGDVPENIARYTSLSVVDQQGRR